MIDRARAIDLALKDYVDMAGNRTETIEFRGSPRSFPVVTISPDVPLLNPGNSRLRAQLANHPRKSIVRTDPNSNEAQSILQGLLSQTEKFEELKKQLQDFKQLEPGIISREGLLVNGNTRLAAIRSLGLSGFDVAVLPQDAMDEDFLNIEMSLQLRNLVHQDYTFTNRLLLVENHLQRTANEDETIKAMQWRRDGRRRLQEHQSCLQLVEEIRELNPLISYAFFDSKEELIRNLIASIKLIGSSAGSAETLKWTRIQAMLLGLNKDEIREMDEDFIQNEVLPLLESEDELGTYFDLYRVRSAQDSVLDELLGDNQTQEIDLRALAKDIASKVVDADGMVSDLNIESNFKEIHDQYRKGARRIREDRIAKEMSAEPIVYLKEVTLKIQDLADEIPRMFANDRFDKGSFEYQARKTEKAIQALQDALKRKLEN